MNTESTAEYVLGLDLGANSIGWAIIRTEDGLPVAIADAGVRVFDAGVEGTDSEIAAGKDSSRAAARRVNRLTRRQTERRARRKTTVAKTLQHAGLLPPGDLRDEAQRDAILKELDGALYQKFAECGGDAADQLPYLLRKRALDHPLEPHELGRAIYHLAQRRGFASNRKAPPKEGEDEGIVKKNIHELEQAMEDAGARTLGEYFAGLDPHAKRIRNRWTARQMFKDEFNAIWDAQQPHHPAILTTELYDRLDHALFHQRPLKSQKGLVGGCELEEGRRRAPMALIPAQRFRYLQRLNDLEIIFPDGQERPLNQDERAMVIDRLEHHKEVKYTTIRKALKLPKGAQFNFELGGDKAMLGNDTARIMREVFGDRWEAFPPEDQDRIIDDIRSIQKDETLKKRGMQVWGLNEADAVRFSQVRLEDGYCRLSRKALSTIIPSLEQGVQYATARKALYPQSFAAGRVYDTLPMVDRAPIELRNPAVHRTLTELRKVVNGIIARHGKPHIIRIELARDLKRSKSERERMTKQNNQNRKRRETAAKKILDEMGDPRPSRDDILKVQLADECGWICPYTGNSISMAALLGDQSQFDIEHIIPYSRCLDNSYTNKTLCYHEENRSVKRNRTPYETYAGDVDRWNEIIDRVKRFTGDKAVCAAKLRRFQMQDLEDFDSYVARQLNDTRYASTLAADYLGLLYGGQIDADHKRRIQAGRGQITADLRNAWNLNSILGDGGTKSRDDHRHHAIDAMVTALTSSRIVKQISNASEQAGRQGRRTVWKLIPQPWEGFLKDVDNAIQVITVSHRVSRKVRGPLHEETIYSRAHVDENGKRWVHVRKPLAAMSARDVENIVDDAVRDAVEQALYEFGSREPAKAFASEDNWPTLNSRIPIKAARVKKAEKTFTVGRKKHRAREVVPKENQHVEIIELTDKKGALEWDDLIVDRYEALRRLKAREPIVRRDHGPGIRFVMSLARGDIIELDTEDGGREAYVIRGVSKRYITYVRLNEARLKKDVIDAKEWGMLRSMTRMQNLHIKKLSITPLGELRDAND